LEKRDRCVSRLPTERMYSVSQIGQSGGKERTKMPEGGNAPPPKRETEKVKNREGVGGQFQAEDHMWKARQLLHFRGSRKRGNLNSPTGKKSKRGAFCGDLAPKGTGRRQEGHINLSRETDGVGGRGNAVEKKGGGWKKKNRKEDFKLPLEVTPRTKCLGKAAAGKGLAPQESRVKLVLIKEQASAQG